MAYASRQSSYLIGSIGAAVQVLAGWWDVYSHLLLNGADPWWNPAHLTLYSGIAITIIAVWRGLRVSPTRPALTPIRFENTAGLKLAGVGCVIEIIAGVWNEIVHHVFLHEPRIAPAHALLTVGMLTVNSGMVVGLVIEYGLIKHGIVVASMFRRRLTLFCVILTFAAIWLAAAGGLIYVAGIFRASRFDWIIAVFLTLIGSLVLVPAKRVLPKLGTAVSIGVVFNAVSYFFLVVFLENPAYVPWGLLPLALFELLVLGLSQVMGMNRAILISSLTMGPLFWAVYYPFTLYLFPWSSAPQPLSVALFLGGAAGTFLGNRIYSGLSSVVLGDVRPP